MKKGIGAIVSVINGLTSIQTIKKGLTTVYESFKELLISGIPPLTLLNVYHNESNEKYNKLIDYKIYGNSVQNDLIDINNNANVGNVIGIDISKLVIGNTYILMSNVTLDTVKISTSYNGYNSVMGQNLKEFTFTMAKHEGIASISKQYLFIKYKGTWITDVSTIKDCNLRIVEILPTPDTPVEVESVGEKSKNLFDFDNITENALLKKNEDGSITVMSYPSSSGKTLKQLCPTLKVGQTITFSMITNGYHQIYLKNNTTSTAFYWNNKQAKEITEEILNSTVYFYKQSSAQGGENSTIYNIQFEEGSTATEYEPYGYKIPVTVRGKNLFDASKIKNTNITVEENKIYLPHYTSGGGYTNTNTRLSNLCPRLKVGDTIVIDFETTRSGNKYIYFLGEDKTLVAGTPKTITQETLDSNVVLYGNNANNGETEQVVITDFQLEIGSTPTEYEPYVEPVTTNIYLDEPLRKIGDYADCIDFETGKVVRNIKYREFSEDDSWSVYTSVSNHFQVKVGDNYFARVENYVMSNYYPNSKNENYYSSTKDYCILSVDDSRIRFKNKDCITLDEWKIHLSSLKTPLYAIYRLKTPTEETIDLPTIPTHKGTTVIEIDTSIIPSNMEVKYYGK